MIPEAKTRYSAISLFSGAGGLDLGPESAGFDVCAALEIDQDRVATLRKNRDWLIYSDLLL
jgi:DNA (cytosine-5)-methyltransferase 1